MTPAESQALNELKSAANVVDAAYPQLRQINTFASAGEFTQRTVLSFPGGQWAMIGKSGGEHGFVPPGWSGQNVQVTRPDGVQESIFISKLSHDAVWYLPLQRQYKLLANSAANEPGDWPHGPARLDSYMIEPVSDYRWQNPPMVAPPISGGQPPVPGPTPSPCDQKFPPRDEALVFFSALSNKYQQKGRADRCNPMADGQPREPLFTDNEGISVWYAEYLRHRVAGKSHVDATNAVMSQIDAAWQ